ncbi:PqqD family protein [Chloroflexi bacterium TSY]|nr:PqqD family protein [Chloroflexi bacterium TSY]
MSNPQKVTTVRTEAVGDGLGIYDYQRDESYVLNATSALVWQHCDGKTTPQQLTTLIQQKFNVVRLQAEHLLSSALNELEQAKLLRRGTTPQPTLSRRHVLQGFAAAGLSLALLPVVAPVTVYAGGQQW